MLDADAEKAGTTVREKREENRAKKTACERGEKTFRTDGKEEVNSVTGGKENLTVEGTCNALGEAMMA